MAGPFVRARRAADRPREDGAVRGCHPADARARMPGDGAGAPRRAYHTGRRQDTARHRTGRADRDGRIPRHHDVRADAACGGFHRADALRWGRRRRAHEQVRPAGLRARRDRRGAPCHGGNVPPLHRLVHAKPELQGAGRDGNARPRRRGGAGCGVRERGLRVRRPRRDKQRLVGAHRAADGDGRVAGLLQHPHHGGRLEPGRSRGGDGGRAQPSGRGRPPSCLRPRSSRPNGWPRF